MASISAGDNGCPASSANAAQDVAVVVAQVALEVVGPVERPAPRGQGVLEGAQVQAFGVGEHAVEIEDDRARVGHLAVPPSRSPAGIATASRFSRGGTGQSYVEL